jgi:hypothetical protein
VAAVAFQYTGRRWCLTTERGRFVGGTVFDYMTNEGADRKNDLRERARRVGVQSPRAVRGPDGNLIQRVRGENWRVDEWLDVGPAPLPPVTAAAARRVGSLLASIHSIAEPAAGQIHPYLTRRHTGEEWHTLIDRARAANKPWVDDVIGLLPTVERLSAVQSPTPDDRVFSICDLTPEAVRLGPDGDLIVMHWEFAGTTVPAWELAGVLMQWTHGPRGEVNVVAARGIAEGYASVAGALPALSLESFTQTVTAWLNWTYNQICDAIDASDAERAAFSEQEMRDCLDDPLTIDKIQAMLDAVASADLTSLAST